MTRRLGAAAVPVLAAVLLLAGCASSTAGSAQPVTGDGSSGEPLPAGTPTVAHPLDVSRFLQDPCAVLTAAQLRRLTVAAAGTVVTDNPTGPACNWPDVDGPSKSTVNVIFLTAGHGLGDIYGQRETYAYFQPLPDIEGYPAVIAEPVDGRQQGLCGTEVGVSNDLAVDVTVQLLPAHNGGRADAAMPCPVVEQVAALVVQTLKGA